MVEIRFDTSTERRGEMPIAAKWDNPEKTFLVIEFSGTWNADDFEEATRKSHNMIMEQPHPVCVISVFNNGDVLPKGLLSKLYRTQFMTPSNQAMHIIVGSSPFVRSLFSTLKRITGRSSASIRLVDTLGEAKAICAGDFDPE
jgi:hypothetical protein